MKSTKLPHTLIFIGILLLLSVVTLGNSILTKIADMNGTYSMTKITIGAKQNTFTLNDIDKLKDELKTNKVAYATYTDSTVMHNKASYKVRLNGVNYLYSNFNNLNLKNGGFFTSNTEDENDAVAIIDDELALQIFNTENAMGMSIEIYGRVFKVIGVSAKDESIIQTLCDNDVPNVYIPATVLVELDKNIKITSIQIKTNNASVSGKNVEDVSKALMALGKNPDNYIITDFNIEGILLEQKPALAVFLAGLVSMLLLLMYLIAEVKNIYSTVKTGYKTDYLLNVIRFNLSKIALLKILGIVSGIVLIWRVIKFDIYIPSRYIPDELIDFSYFLDLFKSNIQQSVSNMGYIPPPVESALNTATLLGNLLFCIGIPLGFLLLYIGLFLLKSIRVDPITTALYSSIWTVLSTGILMVAARLLNLPFRLEAVSTIVIWLFIFINILFIIKRKESDTYYV